MIAEFTVLLTLATHHVLIGAVVIAGLAIANKVMKLSAEAKSWTWLTGFVLSTLLPFLSLTSPFTQKANQQLEEGLLVVRTSDAPIVSHENPIRYNDIVTQQWHVPGELAYYLSGLLYLFCALWLAGTCWRAAQVLRSVSKARKLKSQAVEVFLPKIGSTRVLQSDEATSPLVIGMITPVIILPTRFVQNLSPVQLKPILLHEHAHIRRGDLWVGAMQESLAILFWWSPLIRIMNRKIHIYRELACDIRAADSLHSQKVYAQSLLDSAKLMLNKQENLLAMALFSKKKELNYRINKVLEHREKAKPKLLPIGIGCIALVVTTGIMAKQYVPHIDLSDVAREANHFSKQSLRQSETLIEAVNNKDIELLTFLINRGTDINVPLYGDGTVLMIAVKNANIEMVTALIELGADVNQSSLGDGNPLIIAAKRNDINIAKLLIANGADVNAIVPGDETPLIHASWNGHVEMVEFLVDQGADVNLGVLANKFTRPEWRSPLSKAKNQQVEAFLLAKGAVTR